MLPLASMNLLTGMLMAKNETTQNMVRLPSCLSVNLIADVCWRSCIGIFVSVSAVSEPVSPVFFCTCDLCFVCRAGCVCFVCLCAFYFGGRSGTRCKNKKEFGDTELMRAEKAKGRKIETGGRRSDEDV